ncbi:hypothetical protein B0H13DRAFT_2352788 [Mycena leptocephala]|nr:hypothetical protein B0H13DRAFT_2352788 [Mycena leptocephala]
MTKFGLWRSYKHRPTYDPDSLITTEDLSNQFPPSDSNGDALQAPEKPVPHSSNISSSESLLMGWKNNGHTTKTAGQLNSLVHDVLRDPNFNVEDLKGFNAERAQKMVEKDADPRAFPPGSSRSLCIIPDDIRAIGGVQLKNCLRSLFETEVMLGFRYGEDYDGSRNASWLDLNIPGWKPRAEARREEELEQERVWGFDNPCPPFPSLSVLCVVGRHTDIAPSFRHCISPLPLPPPLQFRRSLWNRLLPRPWWTTTQTMTPLPTPRPVRGGITAFCESAAATQARPSPSLLSLAIIAYLTRYSDDYIENLGFDA